MRPVHPETLRRPEKSYRLGARDESAALVLQASIQCMTLARQQLGRTGEELAVAELERRGYAIVARRYRTRCGEIDIVAEDEGTLVFVEVKARATAEFGTAAEAVTPQKQRKLVAMAIDYLARAQIRNRPCRFDVVAIDDCDVNPRIVVYPNAFEASGRWS